MIDNLTSANHQDFRARYENTFGYLLYNDQKFLVHLDKISSRRAHFITKDGREGNVVVDSNLKFEFIQVQRGVYTTDKDELFFLKRVPARQWKRGIATTNTEIYVYAPNDPFNYWKQVPLSLPLLCQIFERISPLTHDLEHWRKRNKKYFVPSQYFAFTSKKVFFYNQLVGDVIWVNGEPNILLTERIVYQELADINRDLHLGLNIVDK